MERPTVLTRVDGVLDNLKRSGWAARKLELSAADGEALRVQALGILNMWVKPDGIESYRDVPLALGAESGITASRDGSTKFYPLI